MIYGASNSKRGSPLDWAGFCGSFGPVGGRILKKRGLKYPNRHTKILQVGDLAVTFKAVFEDHGKGRRFMGPFVVKTFDAEADVVLAQIVELVNSAGGHLVLTPVEPPEGFFPVPPLDT